MKVIPCTFACLYLPSYPLHVRLDDFFVGIGDINSTFLPKIDPSTPAPIPAPPAGSEFKPSPSTNVTAPAPGTSTNDSVSSTTPSAASADATTAGDSLVLQNNAALDAQLEERPLAKAERKLQEHEKEEAEQSPTEADTSPSPTPESDKENKDHQKDDHHHRKALLKNDDAELQRVGKVLACLLAVCRLVCAHSFCSSCSSLMKCTNATSQPMTPTRETRPGAELLLT